MHYSPFWCCLTPLQWRYRNRVYKDILLHNYCISCPNVRLVMRPKPFDDRWAVCALSVRTFWIWRKTKFPFSIRLPITYIENLGTQICDRSHRMTTPTTVAGSRFLTRVQETGRKTSSISERPSILLHGSFLMANDSLEMRQFIFSRIQFVPFSISHYLTASEPTWSLTNWSWIYLCHTDVLMRTPPPPTLMARPPPYFFISA